jgi:hypothetical protein
MPTTRKRGASIAVATLGLLLNGALAGCSLSKDDDTDKHDTSSAPEPTTTPTTEPSETPSATPTPSSTASSPTAAPKPQDALLSAAELPPLNASSPWTQGATATPGQTNFGLCQQFDLLSIGAVTVIGRSYKGPPSGGDTAGQQVAEFPDAQNTVRADKVLEAWHASCRRKVLDKMSSVQHAKVGAIAAVSVPKGKGWYYVVSYTQAGKGHFHEFGVVYDRNRMSLLKMDHGGQDHSYPSGQDPMQLAVQAASAKMG